MNIALIPARSGSKRIPNKNMMDFCGKPLVQWSIEQALDSELIDQVVVSTDMPRPLPIVIWDRREFRIDYIDRPASLCTDTTTQEEVIAHAIAELQLKDDDNIVLLQPTSPLRLEGDIDRCIEQKAFSVTLEDDLFLWHGASCLTFDLHERQLFHRDFLRENGSIYFKNVGDWRSRSYPLRYPDGHNTYIMQKWQQFEIDEPDDISLVEFLMKKYVIKEA